jgi:hypothetical protein
LADAVTVYVTEPAVVPEGLVSDCAIVVEDVLVALLEPEILLDDGVHE